MTRPDENEFRAINMYLWLFLPFLSFKAFILLICLFSEYSWRSKIRRKTDFYKYFKYLHNITTCEINIPPIYKTNSHEYKTLFMFATAKQFSMPNQNVFPQMSSIN